MSVCVSLEGNPLLKGNHPWKHTCKINKSKAPPPLQHGRGGKGNLLKPRPPALWQPQWLPPWNPGVERPQSQLIFGGQWGGGHPSGDRNLASRWSSSRWEKAFQLNSPNGGPGYPQCLVNSSRAPPPHPSSPWEACCVQKSAWSPCVPFEHPRPDQFERIYGDL